MGPKAFRMSLSRLETSQSTPPFPTLFSQAAQNGRDLPQIVQNAGIAFCGNGFIHLNIAENHEEHIGGQKKCAPIANQGSKWEISPLAWINPSNFLKDGARFSSFFACET